MNGWLFCLERRKCSHVARRALSLIVFFLCAAEIGATTLEEIPIGNWVYPLIDNLQERGHFGDLYLANRPYSRREVAEYCVTLMEKRKDGALEPIEARWVDRLEREFEREISFLEDFDRKSEENYTYRVELYGAPRIDLKDEDIELEPDFESIKYGDSVDPDLYIRTGARASLQYREHIAVVPHFEVNSDPINDPDYRLGNSDVNGRNLNFPLAYLAGRLGPIGFVFGRSNVVWGRGGPDALTVSPVSPGFDLFRYNVEVRTFRATAFVAILDKRFTDGERINRYLYGHRVDWRAAPWLQLGFSESAVVTGRGRGIEFSYLNPLIPYQLIQKEEGEEQIDTDTYASVDGSIHLADHLLFSGELLIDDTFLVRMETNEDFPPQVAFDLEADWTGTPFPSGTTLTASYTRIGSFVYLHRGMATDYSHFGAPIGGILGPDSDRWAVGFSSYLNEDLEIGFDYRQRRRGENRLEPGVSAAGRRDEPFPTGVVEKRKGIGLMVSWFATDDLHFRSDLVYTKVQNVNNEAGQEEDVANLEFSLVYRFVHGGAFR